MAKKLNRSAMIGQVVDKITKNDDMAQKIALGATGVAITATAVAVGVALAHKETRKKLSEGMERTFELVRDMSSNLPEVRERFEAATPLEVKRTKRSSSKES